MTDSFQLTSSMAELLAPKQDEKHVRNHEKEGACSGWRLCARAHCFINAQYRINHEVIKPIYQIFVSNTCSAQPESPNIAISRSS